MCLTGRRRHYNERESQHPHLFGTREFNAEMDPFESRLAVHLFLRKVYSVLILQVAITFGLLLFITYYEPACDFIDNNTTVYWGVSFGLSTFFLLTLVIIGCCCQLSPSICFTLLMCFTIAEGALLGGLSCNFETSSVLMAIGILFALVLGLELFASQVKYDFTSWGPYLLVPAIVLLILGITVIFVHDKILHLVYASLGMLLFGLYLVYDTQTIMKRAKLTQYILPHEYVFAALKLYLDIILIFMFLLQIIGLASRD